MISPRRPAHLTDGKKYDPLLQYVFEMWFYLSAKVKIHEASRAKLNVCWSSEELGRPN